MESLLANYASSDEEEEEQPQRPVSVVPSKPIAEQAETTSSKTSSLLSSLSQPQSFLFQSLPQPKQTPNTTNALIGEDDLEFRSDTTAKSSTIFSSLPQPKQSLVNLSSAASLTVSNDSDGCEVDSIKTSKFSGSSSLFSSLPKPKSQIEQEPATRVSSSGPSTKKVVQFRPPMIPLTKSSELDDDDDDEDDREKENRRKKLESMPQTTSVKSFLSSIPAPRNTVTLGVQTTTGSGRRSILEADAPASTTDGSTAGNNFDADQSARNYATNESYGNYQGGTDQNPGHYMDSDSYGNYSSGIDHSVGAQPEAGTAVNATPTSYYVNNDTYGSYNTYGDYGQYGNNWADESRPAAPEMSGIIDNTVKVSGKRGRNEIPSEVIEVKQEELIKNRPREDQNLSKFIVQFCKFRQCQVGQTMELVVLC